ncbi:hypothetical protein OK17_07635 [Gordonia sp. GN26]
MLMRLTARTSMITVVVALMLSVGGVATATAKPAVRPVAAPMLSFDIPALNGLQLPPDVAGGTLSPVRVVATPAPRTLQYPPPPAAVEFAVPAPAKFDYPYGYRFLSVSWRNLATGKTGVVRLRHWQKPDYPTTSDFARLPTSAVAPTGSGPVIATVRIMQDRATGIQATEVIPGVNVLSVR